MPGHGFRGPMRTRGPSVAPVPAPFPWRDQIVHGDARAVLLRLPPSSVHLAITSPPYNVGIPYAGYSDDRTYEEYRTWLSNVWRPLFRVLVPGGRFALNVAPTSIKNFRPIHHDLTHDLRGLGYALRAEILWYKQTMGRRTAWGSWKSPANPHVIPSWEYVLVFSTGSDRLDGDPRRADITGEEFQRYSDAFWEIPPERNRRGHPAPFPMELIRRLVKFYSYRENTVLDMFGGTGTVAAVAYATGRHFLTSDTSRDYCALALDRLAHTVPEPGVTPPPRPRDVVEGPGLRRAPTGPEARRGQEPDRELSDGVGEERL